MKKAYNEIWVQNLEIQRVSKKWLRKNLLTEEEFEAIKNTFSEEFYRPSIFVKIGLFIFATIACSFFTGFLSLFFLEAAETRISGTILCILCAVLFFLTLKFVIRTRKTFHSGIDNALLYAMIGAIILPIFLLFGHLEAWQYCGLILVVLIWATLYYADILVAILAFLVFVAFFATLLMLSPIGKLLLPFGLMAFSGIIYYFIRKPNDSYYADCQAVIEVLSLIFIYLGGNYLVVREGNALLNDLPTNPSPQVAFAPIFYGLSAVIPFIYLYFGLRRKDRKLLIIGLLTLAFSIFTYRYYFSILPVEWALTLGGILLILLAGFAIRYLTTPQFGITDEPDGERKLTNFEAIVTAQILGKTPTPKGLEFGGGDFGGGGAGSNY